MNDGCPPNIHFCVGSQRANGKLLKNHFLVIFEAKLIEKNRKCKRGKPAGQTRVIP